MTDLSESIKPVKIVKALMTYKSRKAIIKRHLKKKKKIYFNTLITYTRWFKYDRDKL
jgi:hypothetical protein